MLDDDLAVVAEVDAYLRHVRFGADHEVLRERDRLAARVHQLEERDDDRELMTRLNTPRTTP